MAGLIPQNFIDDLLDRVDIVEVIDKRVSLKKAGKNYSACCPFHDEKTPSFSVNPDKQFYYCFGCGAGGNSIGFVMDYENIDFPAAVETLANMAGLEVPHEESSPSSSQRHQQEKNKKASLYDTLQWVTKFYQTQLRSHRDKDKAIDYLKDRGLSGEIARDFCIGYAPAGWDNLLKAAKNTEASMTEQLDATGMLIKKDNGDYYDRFRERVIFPIRDNRGRIIAFGGRVLNDDKPKYLNSPETAIFHKQRELFGLFEARKANRQLDYLLMVEGYMDVVSLAQFGITHAVATLGTASSVFHLEKIFRHTSKLVVCFDGDEAGKKAAARLLETALPIMQDGREICFLFLPDGEDPDTYVRQHGKDAFTHLVEHATTLEAFLFQHAQEGLQIDSDAEKAKFSQRALPLIQQLPNGVFKQLLVQQLADKIGSPVATLLELMQQLKPTGTSRKPEATQTKPNAQHTPSTPKASTPPAADSKTTAISANIGLEKTPIVWTLAIIIFHPELCNEYDSLPIDITAINSPEATLLNTLFTYIKTAKQPVSTNQLLGHWHGKPEGDALKNCAGRHTPPEDKLIAKRELDDTFKRLQETIAEHEFQAFISQLDGKTLADLNAEEREKLRSIKALKDT